MNKIKEIINNLKAKIVPLLVNLDTKFAALMPNPKIRKILYITMATMLGFMFLIIILGLALSPLRTVADPDGSILNKPNIVVSSPEPQKELSEKQKVILNLEIRIKDLKFPESILNTPVLESDIKI